MGGDAGARTGAGAGPEVGEIVLCPDVGVKAAWNIE